MDSYKIEKPDFTKINRKQIIENYLKNQDAYVNFVNKTSENNYYYWDAVKYLTPPLNLNPIEAWYIIKLVRNISSKNTVIKAENGKYFTWYRPNYTDEYLHKIDMKFGGEIFTHYQNIITPYGKQKLLTKSIIEEAIASSQLEGAAITTPVAKKLILENRSPKDKSERMIINNYRTMQAITENFKNQALSNEMLLELHKLITKDTLDSDKQGRYRKDDDNITVNDQMKYIYHTPPNMNFLKEQISELIKYANDENEKDFIHPIIKAIFIHFWLGYLHPFYDGNGRIARTLFYWYLLRKEYWAIQYLPISLVIKNAATQYGMSYIHSEQDDLDITYFYDFHIKKIMEAMKNFEIYIKKKSSENTTIQSKLAGTFQLNDRQYELLRYLTVKDEGSYITPTSFITLYKVSRETTNKDLKKLEKLNLIEKKRFGKNVRYFATKLLYQKIASN
ncbi:MAG: Fic family protein [bacterium]|nr:Fic family protein [bacterium]